MENREYFNENKNKDILTGVYSRDVMYEYINTLIEKNVPFSYAILDVDNFKLVNDTYGHSFGDVVLKEIATQLKDVIGDKGIVGRYGGDEFIMVFENVTNYDDQWQTFFNVLKSPKPITAKGVVDFGFTYTIGVSKFPYDAKTMDELLELADKALYRGKTKGRNCFIIYLEEKHKNIFLQSTRDKNYSSMYLETKMHNELMKEKSLTKGIKNALNFLGSQLMIEQLFIENNGIIEEAYIHPLCKKQTFAPLGNELLASCLNTVGKFFYDNSNMTNKLKEGNPLYKKLNEHNILSSVIIEISYKKNVYGYLRADIVDVGAGRIWQQRDLCLLIALAHQIGLLKYIEELEDKIETE